MSHYLCHGKSAEINICMGQAGQGRVVLNLVKNLINHSSITLCHGWIQLVILIFTIVFGLVTSISLVVIKFL
jgi:hypothetical protein